MLASMSVYDVAAPTFTRDRAVPDEGTQDVRSAVLGAVALPSPRLLDLGAGSGRIGWPFVRAGDDYIGIDLSLGMLRAFCARERMARVVQADGERLPFGDGAFDAVLMIQVFGGARRWRPLLDEARRVLRASGALIVGRTIAPEDGIDARMKQRLATVLDEMGEKPYQTKARADAQSWLEANARGTRAIAARWTATRTPRGFIERHRTGARFARLPDETKEQAMQQLGAWAAQEFGSLDAPAREPHAFELQIFRFDEAAR
jgi:ubiquinone/menaquinone biosynthesis C-methylase UbiE